jgi:hypothetical protein
MCGTQIGRPLRRHAGDDRRPLARTCHGQGSGFLGTKGAFAGLECGGDQTLGRQQTRSSAHREPDATPRGRPTPTVIGDARRLLTVPLTPYLQITVRPRGLGGSGGRCVYRSSRHDLDPNVSSGFRSLWERCPGPRQRVGYDALCWEVRMGRRFPLAGANRLPVGFGTSGPLSVDSPSEQDHTTGRQGVSAGSDLRALGCDQ